MRQFIFTMVLGLLCLPGLAHAQGASVAFGGLKHDSSLPVEVTADQLTVDQNEGTAIFTGQVVVGQGEMRLTADKVQVDYDDAGDISRIHATGDVVMVNGEEAAEGDDAVYTLESSSVVMTGDVILTQGTNALSGQRLVIDLDTGTGVMEGRVKTIFNPGTKNE